jgi:hypothetical protein
MLIADNGYDSTVFFITLLLRLSREREHIPLTTPSAPILSDKGLD